MLRVLQRIVEAVNQAPDFNVALQTMVRQVKEALVTDSCTVYLANHDQQQFVLAATDGLEVKSKKPIYVPFGEGVISMAAFREEPLNIPNAPEHPSFYKLKQVDEQRYKAMLATPLIHRRRLFGVLVVQQAQERAFTRDEEAFIMTLAAQLAVVIAHADAKGILRLTQPKSTLHTLKGVPAAPGVAIGEALVLSPPACLSEVVARRTDMLEHEIRAFRAAVARTKQELNTISASMRGQVAEETLAIFDAYHAMIDSASLGKDVEKEINEGWRAQTALKVVVERLVTQFENLDDEYIRERASDVRDLGNRILAHLQHRETRRLNPPPQCILVADEVTPTMLAELPHTEFLGIVSLRGSSNSHAAILARSMGIPAVLGADNVQLSDVNGELLVVDGYVGDVFINPPLQVENEYRLLADEELVLRQKIMSARGLPIETTDGVRIQLDLNLGLNTERGWLNDLDVHGVGLYRTEIPFMMRDRLPSEAEQEEIYRQVLQQFCGSPVIMRTLDVGGDKPLPYLRLHEENPFLGWRGIRLTLDHPEIFLVQIRAMLRASLDCNNLHILLPMITSAEEVDESIRLIHQAFHEVSEELGEERLQLPKIGVMIEVPGVIYQLQNIASKVDFFSIGTNDLTQYLLAVDRNNARVANMYDALHPGVLHALKAIFDRCQALGKPVSVCGELAGEPSGAMLLIAMGYRHLSMNSYNVDRIRWIIRHLAAADLDDVLVRALRARTAEEVHQVVVLALENAGLGGFVRAGS